MLSERKDGKPGGYSPQQSNTPPQATGIKFETPQGAGYSTLAAVVKVMQA